MPNGSEVLHHPMVGEQEAVIVPSRWIRVGYALGIVAMPDTPPQKAWSFNPAVVILVIAVLTLVILGTRYQTQMDMENQMIMKRLEKAEADAAEAHKLAVYNAGVADTHGKEK